MAKSLLVLDVYDLKGSRSVERFNQTLDSCLELISEGLLLQLVVHDRTSNPDLAHYLQRAYPEVPVLTNPDLADILRLVQPGEASTFKYVLRVNPEATLCKDWHRELLKDIERGNADLCTGQAHYGEGVTRKIQALLDFGFLSQDMNGGSRIALSQLCAVDKELFAQLEEFDGYGARYCRLPNSDADVTVAKHAWSQLPWPGLMGHRFAQGQCLWKRKWHPGLGPLTTDAGLIRPFRIFAKLVRLDFQVMSAQKRAAGYGSGIKLAGIFLIPLLRLVDWLGMTAARKQ